MPELRQPPLTSVVIVSFHTGPALFTLLSSALRQTFPIEIILVDNGNPEDVLVNVKRLAAQDQRIKLITGHGNIGFGRGNNLGVRHAKGDYVLILNPDSKLEDHSLEKLHHHAAALSHPFMIGARLVNMDGTDQRGSRRQLLTPTTAFVEALHLGSFFPRHRLNRNEEPIPSALTAVPAISGAFMFLSRRDFDLIRGFDEKFFLHVEDLDFCLRFRRIGGEIYFAPDVVVFHIGSTSKTTPDFVERHKAKGFSHYFHSNFRANHSLLFLWGLDIAIWGRYLLRRVVHFSGIGPSRT